MNTSGNICPTPCVCVFVCVCVGGNNSWHMCAFVHRSARSLRDWHASKRVCECVCMCVGFEQNIISFQCRGLTSITANWRGLSLSLSPSLSVSLSSWWKRGSWDEVLRKKKIKLMSISEETMTDKMGSYVLLEKWDPFQKKTTKERSTQWMTAGWTQNVCVVWLFEPESLKTWANS